MFLRRKVFRSAVCSILAMLLFIYTTPVYAQGSAQSGTSSGTNATGSEAGSQSSSAQNLPRPPRAQRVPRHRPPLRPPHPP